MEAKSVARSAAMSRSKLSKIENGNVAPGVVDVEQILTALGVPEDVRAEYMSAARATATEATAWRLYRRLGYHRKQQQIQALEAQTALLRLFQPSLVPGLLQTGEYVRAVLAGKGLADGHLARAVSARLARQEVLHKPTKTFRFIITESVLRWRLLPAPAMAAQMDRILAASRLPTTDIRVVPFSALQGEAPSHSFSVKDDRMVTVETVHAELVVTDPRDIETYVRKFERFERVAVAGEEMRSLVSDVRDRYFREQETR